jgi:hypothetical protein
MITEYSMICNWLKSTIPGIVILGTVGSILATLIIISIRFLFKQLCRLFGRILPVGIKQVILKAKKRLHNMAYRYGYEFGTFAGIDKIWGSIVFFSYKVMLSVVWFIFACTLTILFLLLFFAVSNQVLSTASYLCLMLAIISFYKSIRNMLAVIYAFKRFPDIAVPHIAPTLKQKLRKRQIDKEKVDSGNQVKQED